MFFFFQGQQFICVAENGEVGDNLSAQLIF